MGVAVVLGLLAALGVAVAARGRVRRELGMAFCVLLALTSAAAVSAAVAVADRLSNHVWNSVRAAIPVGMTRGIPPYFPAGKGPLWASIYPPGGYVLYLPIALGRTPQEVIYIGQALGVVFLFVPLGWAAWRSTAGRGRGERIAGCVAAVAVALAACAGLPGLESATFTVHVDPPAVGLAVAAAVLVMAGGTSRRGVVVSGVLAAAALFCKQTMLPAAVVLPVWVGLASGRGALGRWLAGFGGAAVVFGVACCVAFDVGGMIHNMFWVPSRQSWREDAVHPLVLTAGEFFRSLGPLPVAAIGAGLAAVAARTAGRWTDRALREPMVLMLLLGVAEVPASIAGYAKVGGNPNNFVYAGFFLLVALCMGVSRWVGEATVPGRIAAATVLGWALISCATTLEELSRQPDAPGRHDAAYFAIQQHPGTFYFPWYPLSHLMAEGRATHQSFGVLDRVLAKERVSPEWLREYMPPDMQYLVLDAPPKPTDFIYHSMEGEFSNVQALPELPGWYVFGRAAP